jgi:hypothetical protein
VQSIQRRKWRWSAAVAEIGFRTGLADSKDEAAMHARQEHHMDARFQKSAKLKTLDRLANHRRSVAEGRPLLSDYLQPGTRDAEDNVNRCSWR